MSGPVADPAKMKTKMTKEKKICRISGIHYLLFGLEWPAFSLWV
jgi:hypothetical protein